MLLEPIMKLEINTPEDFLGDVMADVNGRRGHVTGVEPRGNIQIIRALLPLAESFGYTTDLRSLSQGRATYSMEFSHYQEVADDLASRLTGGRFKKAVKV